MLLLAFHPLLGREAHIDIIAHKRQKLAVLDACPSTTLDRSSRVADEQ